jgi:predicted Zn-dependent protease
MIFAVMPRLATAQQTLATLSGEVIGAETDQRWMVELRPLTDPRSMPPDRTFIQPGGRFQFAGVKAGAYEIVLFDTNQREIKREIASVSAFGSGVVQIRLDDKKSNKAGSRISMRSLSHKIPKAARKEFEHGRREQAKQHPAEAEIHYAKALEIDRQFVEAANDLGALYYRLGRFDDSLRVLEQARAVDPDSPVVLANLAATMMALQRPAEAEPLASRSLRLDPTSIRTRYLFALSRAALKKVDAETRDMLKEVSTLIPHAHLALAQMLVSEGNRQGARAEIEEYLNATKARPAANRGDAERWLKSLR